MSRVSCRKQGEVVLFESICGQGSSTLMAGYFLILVLPLIVCVLCIELLLEKIMSHFKSEYYVGNFWNCILGTHRFLNDLVWYKVITFGWYPFILHNKILVITKNKLSKLKLGSRYSHYMNSLWDISACNEKTRLYQEIFAEKVAS